MSTVTKYLRTHDRIQPDNKLEKVWVKRAEPIPAHFGEKPCALCMQPMVLGIGQVAKYHSECRKYAKKGRHAAGEYLRSLIKEKKPDVVLPEDATAPAPTVIKGPFPGEAVDRHLKAYGHLPELGCCEHDQPEPEK